MIELVHDVYLSIKPYFGLALYINVPIRVDGLFIQLLYIQGHIASVSYELPWTKV